MEKTVQELINELMKIENKSLPIKINCGEDQQYFDIHVEITKERVNLEEYEDSELPNE